jgi:hypothetical protein
VVGRPEKGLHDQAPLIGRGEQSHQPRLVHEWPSLASGLPHLLGEALQPTRLGFRGLDQLVDERQEVPAQPGNPGELQAMGAFVQGHPEAELIGTELVLTLQLQEVRAGKHDRVAARVVPRRDHQFVLAEDPLGENPDQSSDLGGEEPRSDLATKAAPDASFELPFGRGQKPAERIDVGLGPLDPGHHPDRGRADPGEAGLGGGEGRGALHEIGGESCQRGKVIGALEGMGARHAPGNPGGQRPVDRAHRTTR